MMVISNDASQPTQQPTPQPEVQPDISLWQGFKTAFIRKYSVLSGRARRKEYWGFQLFSFLFFLPVNVPYVCAQIGVINSSLTVTTLYFLIAIFFFMPSLAVSVRRLHDIGKSGWWLLIGLIPLIGTLVLLYYYIKEGDHGENRYGPDPKAGLR
ncbi:MAG: DUF805 domain-containing protein [Porphyromonas sp.]|nr:DUF805 domain-containing protein [Porphyromonas sp.]